jgi:LysM repeat protein
MTTIQLNGSQFATPHLRMTARGRRVLLAIVVVPLLIVIAVLALNSGWATASSAPTSLAYVSVQQGESLWQLAEELAPSADPRDVISDIQTLNRLDSVAVVPGQRLAIPAQYLTSK